MGRLLVLRPETVHDYDGAAAYIEKKEEISVDIALQTANGSYCEWQELHAHMFG